VGVPEILLALTALGAWAAVQFPEFSEGLFGAVLVESPDFLGLPGSFWSAVLAVLALVLLVDGILRCRRR
jgi:hypothetical protein